MDKELFELKKRVVSVISDKIYYGLINFAEKIYNADYDVVILMARKASNLYAALFPLVKEEYLGSIQEEHEKRGDHVAKVISDRAIEVVLSDIREHKEKTKYKRILVADDIIIHGTTMASIREKLRMAYAQAGIPEKEYRIDIMAYAENMDGIALNGADICNSETIIKCNMSSWKKISNRIIDVLHLMGRPYTSYVPNAEIKMDSPLGESVRSFIEAGKMQEIKDCNMHRRNVKAYVATLESESKYAICETYRIYEYQDLKKYIFVPMVTINPINEIMLRHYVEALFGYMSSEGKQRIGNVVTNLEGEYAYRVVIYILSALGGWKFFTTILERKAEECIYDPREEIMNFSCPFLREFADLEDEITIDGTLERISDIYNGLQAEMICLEDFVIGEDVGQLEAEVNGIIDYARESERVDEAELSDVIIAKILETNNRLDEAKFIDWERKNQEKIRKRMKGLPVASLYKKLGQINEGIEKNAKAIVHVTDTGKGSIVPFAVEHLNQKIYFSMLRAGEQNYKYYVDNYLPIMYGFCMIESMHLGAAAEKENKEKLWDIYYEDSRLPLFGKKDREYLISNVMMDREFGDVIIEEVLREDDSEIDRMGKIINFQTVG